MSDDLDPVHTIDEWYDGPRGGATEYRGTPHYYRSLYLDSESWNPEEDRFELTPLPVSTLDAILEASRLHERWASAQRAGTLPPEADPDELRVLPPDRERYVAVERERNAYLAAARGNGFIVRGQFLRGTRSVRWSAPLVD